LLLVVVRELSVPRLEFAVKSIYFSPMNPISSLLLILGFAVLLIGFLIRKAASKEGESTVIHLTRNVLLVGILILSFGVILVYP